MKNRRQTPGLVTPFSEDSGLFKKPLAKVCVRLVPLVQRNLRQDIILPGFTETAQEIQVIIAGRRVSQAGPLCKHLAQLALRERRIASGNQSLYIDKGERYYLHAMIEGSWRAKFSRDDSGWESRSYHLIAAHWSIKTPSGVPISFGFPPANDHACRVATERPLSS